MAATWRAFVKRQTSNNGGLDNSGASAEDNDDNYDDDGYNQSWWWSDTGMIVRHVIIVLLFAAVLLYLLLGYFHAKRRLRQGLPPKRYHAWMVRRQYRQPQYNPYYAPQQQGAGYAMPGYQPPPPAYNAFAPPPPAYQPPEGASKAMADQNFAGGATYRPENEEGAGSSAVTPPPVSRT